MPKYRSTNDETRIYPTLGLEVQPGQVVDLPEAVEVHGLVLETKTPAKLAADSNEESK